MEGARRRSLGSQAQHTHSLEDHTWSIQQSTITHTKHIHNIQQQNSNYTQTHCELFHQTQTINKHCQTRNTQTNRHINRAPHNIQGYNITLTTSQVQEAIKQSKNNNSQGPDKLNIRYLKHIGPLGLAFLTSMFKATLTKNIIPHTWKLVNIVPIPKPNKDTDKSTPYMPISILSVIAKTLEKSLLPYITENIPNTPMQHGYKTQHSTVAALHTQNNTVAKGFNQMALPARTITVALDMSKAFDTINIHTLIRKLLQTNIPDTIIKFIANYIKGRKAYTPYINYTSKQRQFITGVPQGGVLSPTLFNIYTSDLPPPSAPVQVMAYAGDITITSTHTSTSAAKKYIQPYQHKVFAWTKQNNLFLNPYKTICTLFTPDPPEYTSHLDLTINNKALPMATYPKVLGFTLDPKLTYSTHIHNISVQAHTPLQIIKALTATGWGKQKETPMDTYKAVMRPALEYSLYGRLLHPRPALTNCKSCRPPHWELPQDGHKTQTYNICMTRHSYSSYTSTYSSMPHNTNRKHNIHHIPYTNTQHTSIL